MHKQGQYLQEIGISFIVKKKITIEDAKKFLSKLVDVLEMEQVNVFEHPLPPGFDVAVNIKEEESMLDAVSFEELKLLFPGIRKAEEVKTILTSKS